MASLDLAKPKDAYIDSSLRTETLIWLSSVRPDGRPHLVPVWFLWDGTVIFIFSQPDNQKIRNITHNPYVMLALKPPAPQNEIVLVEGEATLLTAADATTPLLPGYAAKYGPMMAKMNMSPEGMAHTYSQAIRIVPSKFRTS